MKNNFRISKASIIGTQLLESLDITNEQVESVFGELPKGSDDIDSAYSETLVLSYKYTSDVYTLYTRYGVWRIGGKGSNKHTRELIKLLKK